LFWVYILQCADGSFYTGHTDDLDKRVAEHSVGEGSAHTRRRRPVKLVYTEQFSTRLEALEAELRIKGWSRAKKHALIAGDWDRISRLAHQTRRKR
jgi:putative endonuclease